MYSLPFAAGNIFFASMVDTLLYQAYYKPYIIEFVRLLVGMNQLDNFGYLKKV
jgi:potassium channel subfamily T protein 1